jgi:hypothetical protein
MTGSGQSAGAADEALTMVQPAAPSNEADPDIILEEGDLIDDVEIDEPADDRLSHMRIAAQLDALAATAPERSTIALYGPWGSGKSGIGKLLKTRVEARQGYRFARFDAFKFAETPLRRNFISAVATELGIKKADYHEDLYSGRSSTTMSLPPSRWAQIIGIFLAIVLSLTALLVATVAVVAIFMPGGYGNAFKDLASAVVSAGVVPAALLAGLITMANKNLQVDRTTTRPESDEQFEAIFKNLVTASKADRLVIFVDELDRCAAEEVVATLDAIRTFLGVERCTFVIAADQRVLEEALTEAARQETPSAEDNPYYSTGSAYLDKVFQYQVSVPPLLSQSITRFAADMVLHRGGVWSQINIDYIVSILVPAHVTSPRRVKHLLNAFALAYRLAEDRHRQGLLSESPADSTAALARLVCLRVEFPLFARALTVDARLPQLVLDLSANTKSEWDFEVSPEARAIARRYAVDGAAPATMMDQQDGSEDDASPDDSRPQQGTAFESNRQLLTYLRRTRSVQGPSRDLIFMQSTGTDFGLDGQSAIEIERAAQNADVESLNARLEDADPNFREGALRLLVHQMRTAVGLEASNAARAFLGALNADNTLPVDVVADAASEAIMLLDDSDASLLDEDTMASAWAVASAGTSDGADALRRLILSRMAASDVGMDTSFLLESPDAALALDEQSFAQIVAVNVVSEDAEVALEIIEALPPSTRQRVLAASFSTVGAALKQVCAAYDAFEKEQNAATAATTTTARRAVAEDEVNETEPLNPSVPVNALTKLAERLGPAQGDGSEFVLLMLLAADHVTARNAVEALLGNDAVPLVRNPSTVTAILSRSGVQMRKALYMERWFRGIDSAAILPQHRPSLTSALNKAWSTLDGDSQSPDAARDGLVSSIATLVERLPEGQRPDLTSTAQAAFEQAWPKDEETAQTQNQLLEAVRLFARAGLLNEAPVLREAVARLQDALAETVPAPVGRDSSFGQHLLEMAPAAVRGAGLKDEAGQQLVSAVIAECQTSTVLTEPMKTEFILSIVQASGFAADQFSLGVDADSVVGLIEDHGTEARRAVVLWFTTAAPSVEQAAKVYDALVAGRMISEPVAAAISTTRATWSGDDRSTFLRRYISGDALGDPSPNELLALGFASADPADVADILVDRFASASNNPERQTVVNLWRTAAITENALTKKLIEKIAIPLFELNADGHNVQAANIGFVALEGLSTLPRGVKASLGTAVKNAVGENDTLEKRAVKVMPGLGYNLERTGWFRRKSRPKYDDRDG